MELYIALMTKYGDISEVIGVFDDDKKAMKGCEIWEIDYPSSTGIEWIGQDSVNGHKGEWGIGDDWRHYVIKTITINETLGMGAVTL